MKKLFVIFLLIGLAAGADVQAQYWYPGSVKAWGPQWVYYGGGYSGYWVINHGHGQFGDYYPGYYGGYGYYDLNLGPRARATLGGALLGGAIGALAGGRKGAAIGAIGGGTIGWLAGKERADYRLPQQGRYPNDYGDDVFKIRNRSRYAVDIYDGDQFVFQLHPGDAVRVPRPRYQYRGYALMAGYGGRVVEKEIWLSATSYGWEIVR